MKRLTKFKNVVLAIVLLCMGTTSYGQLKVKAPYGKVLIGPNITSSTEDAGNILSASIYGRSIFPAVNNNGGGSKLAFGDFGKYSSYGWNVFIGEWTYNDTDILWLHGKSGFRFTFGRADSNEVLLSYNAETNAPLYVYTTLNVQRYLTQSNISSIHNPSPINDSYNRLLSLQGLSYETNYSMTQSPSNFEIENMSIENDIESDVSLSEKEQRDIEHFTNLSNYRNEHKDKVFGFNAEELKEVFPELVVTDALGNNSIDYVGLIPILVEAIKEQNQIIEALGYKVKEVKTLSDTNLYNSEINSTAEATQKTSVKVSTMATACLYQNTPNPFTTTTEISYFLPESASNAYIYIFDMQGAMLSSNALTSTGFGSITINGSSLNPGMYMYSLFIDGQEIETKKMVLTN